MSGESEALRFPRFFNKKMHSMSFAKSCMPVLSLLFLMGCEGGTTFTKVVKNGSPETLTLKITTSFLHTDSETFVIEPGRQETIFWSDKTGFFTDGTYTCASEIETVSVSVSNGKNLVKSLLDANNWERESKGGRNSTEKCTFVLTDNDLE